MSPASRSRLSRIDSCRKAAYDPPHRDDTFIGEMENLCLQISPARLCQWRTPPIIAAFITRYVCANGKKSSFRNPATVHHPETTSLILSLTITPACARRGEKNERGVIATDTQVHRTRYKSSASIKAQRSKRPRKEERERNAVQLHQ